MAPKAVHNPGNETDIVKPGRTIHIQSGLYTVTNVATLTALRDKVEQHSPQQKATSGEVICYTRTIPESEDPHEEWRVQYNDAADAYTLQNLATGLFMTSRQYDTTKPGDVQQSAVEEQDVYLSTELDFWVLRRTNQLAAYYVMPKYESVNRGDKVLTLKEEKQEGLLQGPSDAESDPQVTTWQNVVLRAANGSTKQFWLFAADPLDGPGLQQGLGTVI
ncbi:hypothetical protein CALVIDRAFT_560694 [Calocera viscosa TUFC12733]|uniref:Ricin B lectin domain-containing protein n=1 Tax=Calocera viscosa (strain TUFC12733) TaxID=1330018 RepID=A0A167QN80_CALVF|nr:hypothetical protein CALVIDRAFT_560694 [Calocera viscosa TUFC12733]